MKLSVFAFLCAVLVPVLTTQAQERSDNSSPESRFNWGARIGFAATGTYVSGAYIENHKLSEYTQDTQVGNFAAMMLRWNFNKFLIQSGLGLSFNKSSFFMDKNGWDKQAESRNDFSCSYSMLSFTLPIQAGFHIVNRKPYCMSAFTGTRLRYTPDKYYSVTYENLDPYSFKDSQTRFILGWTAGLSVQIGGTFLDFEYEYSLNDITGNLYDTSGADPAPFYRLDKRVGIISFSYGIIF